MTRAPAPAQIDLIGELFTAVDSGDTGTAAALFTDDIRFAFGNNPPVYGHSMRCPDRVTDPTPPCAR
jgi:hypothetical protein